MCRIRQTHAANRIPLDNGSVWHDWDRFLSGDVSEDSLVISDSHALLMRACTLGFAWAQKGWEPRSLLGFSRDWALLTHGEEDAVAASALALLAFFVLRGQDIATAIERVFAESEMFGWSLDYFVAIEYAVYGGVRKNPGSGIKACVVDVLQSLISPGLENGTELSQLLSRVLEESSVKSLSGHRTNAISKQGPTPQIVTEI